MYFVFVSSLHENQKIANFFQQQLQELHQEVELINLVHLELPMYDSDKEETEGIPQLIIELAEKMKSAKGYIFVTPEYNYCIPPVLANFISWISRIGDDFRKVFTNKYIQLATHSGSGGKDLLNSQRIQFSKLGAFVMPREVIATYEKPFREESASKILKQFVNVTTFQKEY